MESLKRGALAVARLLCCLVIGLPSVCVSADPRPLSAVESGADPVVEPSVDLAAAETGEPRPGEELAGGATTVFDARQGAFGHAVRTLRRGRWLPMRDGGRLFETSWSPPERAAARGVLRGLGPLANAVACTDCHFRDGRGGPPPAARSSAGDVASAAGPTPAPRLARLRRSTGEPDPRYGHQLNDRGVGVPGEGLLTVRSIETTLRLGERQHRLRRLEPVVSGLVRGPLHDDTRVALRVPPALVGLGLLEAVPASHLESLADPSDLDGDGISGRLRRTGDGRVGRFGWKAAQPDLESQITAALADDLGVTSSPRPQANCPAGDEACRRLASKSVGVELSDHQLERLALYVRLLAPPARRDWRAADVRRGRGVFESIGCAACHRPSLPTAIPAEDPDVLPELAGHTIRPYTDLLLHDLGPDLADPAPEPGAAAGEWRTAPLWGLGLLETVNGHLELLHDGRARTIPEAILWHGGEAAASRDRFGALRGRDREALVRFLESL